MCHGQQLDCITLLVGMCTTIVRISCVRWMTINYMLSIDHEKGRQLPTNPLFHYVPYSYPIFHIIIPYNEKYHYAIMSIMDTHKYDIPFSICLFIIPYIIYCIWRCHSVQPSLGLRCDRIGHWELALFLGLRGCRQALLVMDSVGNWKTTIFTLWL
jgi:hypothetical protein